MTNKVMVTPTTAANELPEHEPISAADASICLELALRLANAGHGRDFTGLHLLPYYLDELVVARNVTTALVQACQGVRTVIDNRNCP
jgi:hypothetical protein